jgi:hypothetical protein
MLTLVGSPHWGLHVKSGMWCGYNKVSCFIVLALFGASCSRLLVLRFRSSTSAMDLLMSLVMKRCVA